MTENARIFASPVLSRRFTVLLIPNIGSKSNDGCCFINIHL